MAEETWTIRTLRKKIVSGELDLQTVVNRYLDRIQENQSLNAFLDVYADEARKRAMKIQEKIRTRTAGPLAGSVIALKDNIAVRDKKLTCASRILANFVSTYDATVVKKLLAADAILIGKTNMDEFAMGSSSENSAFLPVNNPHHPERVPGGSSGGSAAAVAADLCTAALGSDTGGSIRQPAAFCGVVGMKPTYGRVSRFGLVAFASSLDQIGPITRTVEDMAVVLQVISGHDPRDSTSAPQDAPDFASPLNESLQDKTVGIPAQYIPNELQPEIKTAIEQAKEAFIDAGANVVEVSLPLTEYCVAAYYVICTAEASSNLARYDGARFGLRSSEADTVERMYTKSRSEGFGREVKRRIMLGTYVLSAGYYDAYYRRALKVRTLIRRDFERAFAKCDFLLTPTTPTTAFKLGEKVKDPISMYLSDIFTVSANLSGLPGISIPAGKDQSGLPIGLQLLGKPFDEAILLQAASCLERYF